MNVAVGELAALLTRMVIEPIGSGEKPPPPPKNALSYYTVDGRRHQAADLANLNDGIADAMAAGRTRIKSRPVYRDGRRYVVSTIFSPYPIGDHLPPRLWQSCVLQYPRVGWDQGVPVHCWTYSTASAARTGHNIIVATVRDGGGELW